jgi:hypothetical protein
MFTRKALSATGSMKIDAIFTNLETTGRFLHVLPVVGTSLAYGWTISTAYMAYIAILVLVDTDNTLWTTSL